MTPFDEFIENDARESLINVNTLFSRDLDSETYLLAFKNGAHYGRTLTLKSEEVMGLVAKIVELEKIIKELYHDDVNREIIDRAYGIVQDDDNK